MTTLDGASLRGYSRRIRQVKWGRPGCCDNSASIAQRVGGSLALPTGSVDEVARCQSAGVIAVFASLPIVTASCGQESVPPVASPPIMSAVSPIDESNLIDGPHRAMRAAGSPRRTPEVPSGRDVSRTRIARAALATRRRVVRRAWMRLSRAHVSTTVA